MLLARSGALVGALESLPANKKRAASACGAGSSGRRASAPTSRYNAPLRSNITGSVRTMICRSWTTDCRWMYSKS